MSSKILVIGYDGGTLDIITPFIKEGQLPTFTKMMRSGVFGELQSVYPPVSAPAWVSFMTGKNPGKHSVFNFTLKCIDTYYVEPATSASINSITLWELLSLENKRIAVLNVPLTYPPKKINGIMVSGLGTPDDKSDFIYPSSFAEEFKNVVSEYAVDVGWAKYEDDHLDEFFDNLTILTQKTYDLAKYCIRKEEWDFFMVVFIGPDRMQHRLWNSIKNEKTDTRNCYKKIKTYFNYLDSLIGKLILESGDESTVILLSDHGFGPFVCDVDLNNWFATEGLLKYSSRDINATGHLLKYTKQLIRNLGISKDWILKKFGKRLDVYKYLEKSSSQINKIDWSQTKAFCFSSHFIYLNVRGRERQGIINPGREYESFRDEIIKKLYSLKDPETGRQVIRKVQRIEEVYNGHDLSKSPDLIITEYNEAGYVGVDRIFQRQNDNKIFTKTAKTQEGAHRLNGFFTISGRNIRKGNKIEGANIMDLFPTILFMFGINIPDDIDGRVLLNIFEETTEAPIFEKRDAVTSNSYNLSEDEKTKMIERLKSLGYL